MKLSVTVGYEIDGQRTQRFPYGEALAKAKPINVELPGWTEDISGCRTEAELPLNARRYIEFIERNIGCPITYVSVGAERDQYIRRTPEIKRG